MRQINVAAPDPVPLMLGARFDQGQWLRIVDHGKVAIKMKAPAILFGSGKEQIEMLFPRLIRVAVERVVKGLGHFKEIPAAGEHIPTRMKSQFLHQWDQAVEDFGYPSTRWRGVHHLHCASRKLSGYRSQFVDLRRANQRNVIVQVNWVSFRTCDTVRDIARNAHAASSRSMYFASCPLAPSTVLVYTSI